MRTSGAKGLTTFALISGPRAQKSFGAVGGVRGNALPLIHNPAPGERIMTKARAFDVFRWTAAAGRARACARNPRPDNVTHGLSRGYLNNCYDRLNTRMVNFRINV